MKTQTNELKSIPLSKQAIRNMWEYCVGYDIDLVESGVLMYIRPDEIIEFAREIEATHGIEGGEP